MNKFKIISFFLALALLFALYRLYGLQHAETTTTALPAYDVIMSRASVRDYQPKMIPNATLDSLCRAGMASPTALDRRPWKFIVVTDKKLLLELAEVQSYKNHLRNAGGAIVVCAETQISPEWWIQDCSAASENILLAAHAMGLGGVWVSVYPNEKNVALVRNVLNIPDGITPLNIISLGFPKATPQPKDKYNPQAILYNRGDFPIDAKVDDEDSGDLAF